MAEAPGERTQSAVGLLLGVSQSAVGQWLADSTRPSARLRQALERLTGIEAAAWETREERLDREALEERLASATGS